jgi:hypothetical protein
VLAPKGRSLQGSEHCQTRRPASQGERFDVGAGRGIGRYALKRDSVPLEKGARFGRSV